MDLARWEMELERRLAVARWNRDAAEAATAAARVAADRAPVLARRKAETARARDESVLMRSGEICPEALEGRTARIIAENSSWASDTALWEEEDQLTFIRAAQFEGRWSAELERWLREDERLVMGAGEPGSSAHCRV
jgi:hypothetical protein